MPARDVRLRGTRTAFWVIAAFGIPAAAVAWNWYALAQFEAQSEQSKALSAQTTMAGFAEVWGGVPLVLAHIVGLVTLFVLGWKGYRGRGIALAMGAVVIASVIGIGITQLLWAGELFQLGIDNDVYVP
ncbi:hypothetical protein J7E28_17240 [Microbacterium sp. ISL-108]|nr:hypothetical protein [Microbacterium sp. ISL-108]RKN69688.1 hypothetical protein D7252_17225 [Microbacterium sp. CGR2]